jgi:hypothetical protein
MRCKTKEVKKARRRVQDMKKNGKWDEKENKIKR